MQKKIIIYAIIIVIILVIVFLSQQNYFKAFGKTLVSDATDQASAYMMKESNWVMSNVYPKVSGEVEQRGDIIKTEVTQEKQKVSENIGTKLENYFSGVANSVLHPGQTNNCPVPPTQNSTN